MTTETAHEPSVLVALLSWNQRRETIACLASLQRAEYTNRRILVVDNGSSDQTADAVRQQYPNVELLKSPSNVGCAGGRNLALRYGLAAGADYVLFLDNDTLVPRDLLRRLVAVARTDPSIGLASVKIVQHQDPSKLWVAGGDIDEDHFPYAPGYGEDASQVPNEPYAVRWVPGCVMFAKRQAIERVGLFDDRYFIYFEDTDWCMRAAALGYRIVVEPRAEVLHRMSQSQGGRLAPTKFYYMTRNRLLFTSMHTPRSQRRHALTVALRRDYEEALDDARDRGDAVSFVSRLVGAADFARRRFGPAPRWMTRWQ